MKRREFFYDSASARFRPGVAGAHTDIAAGLRQYSYDATGNVVADGGKAITWTPYGKVESVEKETGAGVVRFLYDAQGNRVLKEETGAGGVVSKRTWYMRDAAGQHLATYEHTDTTVAPRAKEYLLYGSGRLGTAYADNANGGAPVSGALYCRVVGKKQYELSDHLGNVRATVGDVKVRSGSTFAARVESFTEYFAFGMEAKSGGSGGRFGFNGMEKDNEVKGGGNHVDFGARYLDVRTGVWGSCDPLEHRYAPVSPYAFALSNPVWNIDADGRVVINTGGKIIDLFRTLAKLAGLEELSIFEEGGCRSNEYLYLGVGRHKNDNTGWYSRDITYYYRESFRFYSVINVPYAVTFNPPSYTTTISNNLRLDHYLSGELIHSLNMSQDRIDALLQVEKMNIQSVDDVSDDFLDKVLGLVFSYTHEVEAHATSDFPQDHSSNMSISKIGKEEHEAFGNEEMGDPNDINSFRLSSLYSELTRRVNSEWLRSIVLFSRADIVIRTLTNIFSNPEKKNKAKEAIVRAFRMPQPRILDVDSDEVDVSSPSPASGSESSR